MFIAIDIGNSNTVIAVYNKDKISASVRFKSSPKISRKEINKIIESLLGETKRITSTSVGISSVVPTLTNIYYETLKVLFKKKPLVVDANLNLGINIHYNNPNLLGADRICNAVAGYEKYGGPLIIIDLGTATTFDVIASNGDFLGGVITPGIKTSAIALHKQTAKLPKVSLELPNKIICTNTENSIQAGILWGSIDAMNGIINRIRNELSQIENKNVKIIATGGFSEFAFKHSTQIDYIEPNLVLDGIKLIYEKN